MEHTPHRALYVSAKPWFPMKSALLSIIYIHYIFMRIKVYKYMSDIVERKGGGGEKAYDMVS